MVGDIDLDTSTGIEKYLGNVADNPYVSYWKRDAIKALLKRDPVDAARDAEFLAGWLERRAKLILQGR